MLVRGMDSIATSWSYVGLLFLLLFFWLSCYCSCSCCCGDVGVGCVGPETGALKSWDPTAELTSYKVTVQCLLHGIVRVSMRLGMSDFMIRTEKSGTSKFFFTLHGDTQVFLDGLKVESTKNPRGKCQMTTRFPSMRRGAFNSLISDLHASNLERRARSSITRDSRVPGTQRVKLVILQSLETKTWEGWFRNFSTRDCLRFEPTCIIRDQWHDLVRLHVLHGPADPVGWAVPVGQANQEPPISWNIEILKTR